MTGKPMSALRNRNVTLRGRRTSLRLEMAMWEGLEEICQREQLTIHEVCALVENQRGSLSLTAAVRVFILTYFRAASTEAGHRAAGHGKRPLLERSTAAIAAVKRSGRGNPPRRRSQATG